MDLSEEKQITYQELLDAWPELMQRLKNVASTLLTVMKNAQIKSVEQNLILMSFAYKFHKDTLDAKKNKTVFLDVLNDYFKTKFDLKVILEKPQAVENSDTSSIALEVFGEEMA